MRPASKERSKSTKDSSVGKISLHIAENATKSMTNCQIPVDLVEEKPTKSVLNLDEADTHQVTRHKQSALVPVQTSVGTQVGQLSGSIELRKRAKPELENARYRDISLKLSVQEVKNVTPKGRCKPLKPLTVNYRSCDLQIGASIVRRTAFSPCQRSSCFSAAFQIHLKKSVFVFPHVFRRTTVYFSAFVTIPISDLSQSSEQQKWLPMRSPYDTLHIVNSNNWQELACGGNANEPRRLNSVTGSPGGARSRKRSMPVTCFRPTPSNTDYYETETNPTTEKLKSSGKKKRSWVAGLSTTAEVSAAKQCETSIAKCSSASNSPTYLLKNNVFSLTQSPIPQLRLNILYEAVDVLPLDYYEDFQELLRSHTIDILRFLEPKLSAKQKEELASCIVNIHEKVSNLSVTDLLADLVRQEIAENANQSMLLRANSMASKAIECYIKLVGTEYLHRILKGPIDQLLVSVEDFEVDPHRIKLPDSAGITVISQIERNQAALLNHLSTIWNRILENTRRIPYELREIFTTLRCLFEQTLGPQIAIQLVSSCLFLRFICPAIHGPVLFGLTPSIPESARVSRNLTLLAKVLQNLANMVPFEEKEIHMKIFNPFMEKEIPVMRKFLESISSADLDDDESSYSDCHHYIDLGYEFAKLSSVLSRYVKEEVVPDELSRLPDILKFIHEHTNDTVLSSWTPDMVSCRRFTNYVDAPSQEQPLSQFRRKFTSTDSILTNPHLSNFDAKEFLQSGSVQSFNPESSNIPAEDTESVLFSNEPSVPPSPHLTNDAISTDIIQQYTQIQNANSFLYTWPEVVDSLAEQSGSKVETMEQLISQYKEQLRQLNACIEQVENISLTTKPVNVKKIFQGEGFALPSSLGTVPETRACIGVKNGSRDHEFPWSPINRCGQDGVAITNEGSDYEYGDDEKEVGHGHCRSEPVRFCSSDREVERQKVLAESPSLDQLSDRLQELRHLLKHERHELAQVVAEKTMAIKEQEQSIERMVSELDQLRRHPTPGVGPLHPVNSSARLSTPGTISPSSSFSSGCFASTQSDDLSGNPNERRPSESNAFWYQKSECSVRKHHIQYTGNKLRSQSFHSHSSSNRIKLNGGSEVLGTTQTGPNLLDLSRASEGTGIPLGDLIISKHSIPVKRRTSETKLMRN
ncbi:GTPase-activator protein [Opisthorchis viverrini]|uniref:GTPase-activator protein n=1 Tax=Opisthorchis viverrini TaxID=6198 RepID=A0A1S8WJ48_OPIVI|nr:GTPase-activator protein [Opisthorchis viverrini]